MKIPPPPPIIIDTREQLPYEFLGIASVQRGTLATGDYSLSQHEQSVCVERKSKSDAWGCVGGGRQRFTACLARLGAIGSPAIVIEASLDEFARPPARTRLTAAQAVGAYISWSQEFRIPIFFCPSRAYAERVCLRWLLSYWRHLHDPRKRPKQGVLDVANGNDILRLPEADSR